MAIIRGIHSEFIKLRHTAILWLHLFIPLIGAMVFTFYFIFYPQVTGNQKLSLVLELTAAIFPIVISVVCGMMATLEEKAAGFQVMLSDKNGRVIPYFNKLLTAIILGALAMIVLVSLIGLSLYFTTSNQVAYPRLILGAVGMFIGAIPLYFIQMFLSIRWGLSSSVFVGVIGSLLAIMFSNVDVASWVFIPFAWSMKTMQHLIQVIPLSAKFGGELGIIATISLIFLLFSFIWFQRWEGRKSFE